MQDSLIIEQEHLCAICSEVEKAITEACQHIFYSMAELTLVIKDKWLGETIVQLQDTNILLNDLV